MSIVTLKRKTQAQYKNVSVGQNAFSLNGTRRNAGYIGQDTLGRSLVRSLSKNGALKGHGGCCGTYPIQEIKTSSDMMYLNDSTIVKSSSLNTNGMLMSRYRWVRRPQPFTSVKPDNTRNNNTQSSYIEHISKKTIKEGAKCRENELLTNTIIKPCLSNIPISIPKCSLVTKSNSFTGAINANEHINDLSKKCTNIDDFKIPKNIQRTPLIGT